MCWGGTNHFYSVLEQIHEEAFMEKASSIRRFAEVNLNVGGWLLSGLASYSRHFVYIDAMLF